MEMTTELVQERCEDIYDDIIAMLETRIEEDTTVETAPLEEIALTIVICAMAKKFQAAMASDPETKAFVDEMSDAMELKPESDDSDEPATITDPAPDFSKDFPGGDAA